MRIVRSGGFALPCTPTGRSDGPRSGKGGAVMPFGSLWIPVIVSAVVVFVASSILHMAIKYHKADYKALPNEDAVREAIARGNPAPGVYVTPHCPDMKQMKEPAIVAKFEKG